MLRNRWRSVLGGFTVALTLVTVMVPLVAGADHLPPNDLEPGGPGAAEANDTPFWVDYLDEVRDIEDASCSKINQAGDTAFVMPAEPAGRDWVLVVIKQGIVNYVYYDPAAGHSYPSVGPNAPGFSHVIVCSVAEQVTTTTEEDTTTTTVDDTTTTTVDDTTTTTVDDTTTTTVDDTTTTTVDDTTTTTVDDTTTTTVDDTTTTTAGDTTTTTAGDTTTTGDPGTTSTIPDEVLPTVITSTTLGDEVLGTTIVAGELPFTGFADETLGRLALVILVLGALTLLVAKSISARSNEES